MMYYLTKGGPFPTAYKDALVIWSKYKNNRYRCIKNFKEGFDYDEGRVYQLFDLLKNNCIFRSKILNEVIDRAAIEAL